MANDAYIIRGGLAGRERLRVLSRVMEPLTLELFARVGVRSGDRCLDAGCGGGDVTVVLAALVGDEGSVTGVDLDDTKIAIASEEAAAAGLTNVKYDTVGVHDLPYEDDFDVTHARFLLSHLPDPDGAARALFRATRPGGVVMVEDVDFGGSFCHPSNHAYDGYCRLYTQAAQARGCDPHIGRRLPALLADAGIVDVGVHVGQPVGFDHDVKLLSPLTLENIADAVLALDLATRDELDALVDALYAFAGEPSSILSVPRIVQAWGRVPEQLEA